MKSKVLRQLAEIVEAQKRINDAMLRITDALNICDDAKRSIADSLACYQNAEYNLNTALHQSAARCARCGNLKQGTCDGVKLPR